LLFLQSWEDGKEEIVKMEIEVVVDVKKMFRGCGR
jgi:hypothetical protein